jgi:nitroimidazol reductase NimA-like FMN-containing flavoprotein (pyridoxamine 5'-phosphate oxidase superfamily)
VQLRGCWRQPPRRATIGGVTPEPSGPWTAAQAAAFLAEAVIPVRLATSGTHGPTVQSMWFAWDGTALWCATQRQALVVTRLSRDPRVGFEVAADSPPYRGVRGSAEVTVVPEQGERVLRDLLQRYQGGDSTPLARWLLSRAADEVALRIVPTTLATWDYSSRMSP